jgi:hypothetical protein
MDEMRRDLKFNVERVHKVLAHSAANLVYRQLAADRAGLDFSTLNFSGVDLESITLYDSTRPAPRPHRLIHDVHRVHHAHCLPLTATESPTMTKFSMYRLVEDLDDGGGPASEVARPWPATGGALRLASGALSCQARYHRGTHLEFMDTLAGGGTTSSSATPTPRARPLALPTHRGRGRHVSGAPMAPRPTATRRRRSTARSGCWPTMPPTLDVDAITASREDFLRPACNSRRAWIADAVELAGRVVITDTVIPAGVRCDPAGRTDAPPRSTS